MFGVQVKFMSIAVGLAGHLGNIGYMHDWAHRDANLVFLQAYCLTETQPHRHPDSMQAAAAQDAGWWGQQAADQKRV